MKVRISKIALSILMVITVILGAGCVEHHYYHVHHEHSPEYYHRHHREPGIDVHLHN